mgnify:CR=1 FL=1
MSQLKRLLPFILSGMFLCAAHAESQRTLFTVENQFPNWEQFEAGGSFTFRDGDEDSFAPDTTVSSIYLRYGLLSNLAVQLDVPIVNLDFPRGGDETGLGDMELSFQLLTYEDIFGYPYFIPHVSVTLPTGDEDKGLGNDDPVITAGIAYGSTINDWIDWVIDLSYRINSDQDNQIIVGHSYAWNMSDSFAIITELLYEEALDSDEDSQVLVSAGFSYDWTEKLQLDVSAGGGLTGPVDAYGNVSVRYSF